VVALDAGGGYLFSHRFGAPGVALASPSVSIAATGNLYLLTGFDGSVDFGGGPVTSVSGDHVVASFTAAGAHRWSRSIHVGGLHTAGIDGCGALVVTSVDTNFDLGCGKFLPVSTMFPYGPPYLGIARFAP
jgi:hypothetical protein